jgi:hypothetical protein
MKNRKNNKKAKRLQSIQDNYDFYKSDNVFSAVNIHVSSVRFESTTKSGLMRKLYNYLK